MATGLLHLHNILRWVILILLFVSILVALMGWQSGKPFNPGHKKIWLFTMISAHINFLVGLYLVLVGRFGILTTDLPEGTSFMKDRFFRFFWLEHPLLMLLSIVAITIGHGRAKKALPDSRKYRGAFIFFLVALILILAAIPWPGRELVGRPLLPGM